uniref:U-actitoxin-Nan8a n=1 Tax=Nemanthus annamensis TaxID=1813764 RepID=A0A3P8MJV3_9CNID|nr:U-actitoxin-Nan8a [Nemanthus annamensis]
MKYLAVLFIALLGVVMISGSVMEDDLYELVREFANDPAPRHGRNGCVNRFAKNICGDLVSQKNCRAASRMGRFARQHCQFLCGLC